MVRESGAQRDIFGLGGLFPATGLFPVPLSFSSLLPLPGAGDLGDLFLKLAAATAVADIGESLQDNLFDPMGKDKV